MHPPNALILLPNRFTLAPLSILCLFLGLLIEGQTFATPAPGTPNASSQSYCGTLVGLGGQVEILDASRNQIQELFMKAAIPCGGWVFLSKGWVEIRLRDGFRVYGSQWSFFQLPEYQKETVKQGDQIVLYKGQIFVHATTGSGEFRVMTPNARGRFLRAKGIVLYNEKNEETQLIALEGSGQIENRFRSDRKILVKEGEASTLNFKALRVMPSTPRAVSLVSIRGKLEKLQIESHEKEVLLKKVRARADRKFATRLLTPGRTVIQNPGAGTYQAIDPSEASLYSKHLVNRVVSSESSGENLLHPNQIYSREKSVKIIVSDPTEKKRRQFAKENLEERKRLLDALSEIRPE